MQGELERYNDIIQTQLSQEIVERADEVVKDGREFYIPHKAVLRENAESSKIRIVYDASARANASAPSLNECSVTNSRTLRNLFRSIVTSV